MRALNDPILRLALPAVACNITVPLLSLVDTTIVGHMGQVEAIAAMSVGGSIFSLIYWPFAFLRMATTGIVSQAWGRGDKLFVAQTLVRSLLLGLAIAVGILVLQNPLLAGVTRFMQLDAGLSHPLTRTYFHVCVWGAPAVMAGYAMTGCMVGMQDTRTPLFVAILQNVSNILLSLLFVYGLGMGLAGVALGTVMGLYLGVGFGAWRLWGNAEPDSAFFASKASLRAERRILHSAFDTTFLRVSFDIFLRTLCLVAVTLCFTRFCAQRGDVELAASAVLMQFFVLYSYFMDGLANAAEGLCGEAQGRGDAALLRSLVRRLFRMGAVLAACFTVSYVVGGPSLIGFITSVPPVRRLACLLLPYACAIPAAGMACFIWDGVFIGLTRTRQMLASMFLAMLVFFALHRLMAGSVFFHPVWTAFLAYLFTRGLVQTVCWLWSRPVKGN